LTVSSLADELARLRHEVLQTYPEEANAAFAEAIEELRMLQLAENSLAAGDAFPDFALPDDSGRLVADSDLLAERPLVIAFFRGAWCPYCHAELRFLEQARPEIEAAGATLVGISPDLPETLAQTRASLGLGFLLLSDPEGRLARLCGLRYDVPDRLVDLFITAGIDLPGRHGRDGWSLPLPASYVVDRGGIIAYALADPDWRFRANPEDLVAAARRAAQVTDAGAG
jgi:peroxiredoxin